MGLLCIIMLCAAIHSGIIHGTWNGFIEGILNAVFVFESEFLFKYGITKETMTAGEIPPSIKKYHQQLLAGIMSDKMVDVTLIFTTDEKMTLNEMSSWRNRLRIAKQKSKDTTREGSIYMSGSFRNSGVVVDLFERSVKQHELFIEFRDSQYGMTAGCFVDGSDWFMSEPSIFPFYEKKSGLRSVYSKFSRDVDRKTFSTDNTMNTMMLVMVQNAYTIEFSFSFGMYDSAKGINSTDSMYILSDTGIMFENVSCAADIAIVLENCFTDSFTSLLTDIGGARDYSYSENPRLHLYKNAKTELVFDIENYFFYVLLYDNYCCRNFHSESKCAMECLTLLSLSLGQLIQEEEQHALKIFPRFWLLLLESQCSNNTLMKTDLFDKVWFGDSSSCLLWFENVSNSVSCGYDTHPLPTLDDCLNDTELPFLSHALFLKETYFSTVYLYGMSKKEVIGPYSYLCPIFLSMNDNSRIISRYCVSEKKFFDIFRMTIKFPTIICFSRLDEKDYRENIFTLHFSQNITLTLNTINNSSMSKGVSMDCLFLYIGCNIHHDYIFISDYANRDQRGQLVYQTCSTFIRVEALKMDCLHSNRDDKGCSDDSVLVISIYLSNEEHIFCGTLSINHTLDFTNSRTTQNTYATVFWNFHMEKHSLTDPTDSVDLIIGLRDVGRMFGNDINSFDKIMTVQNTCTGRSESNNNFNFYEENEVLHQSCKFSLCKHVTNKLVFKIREDFCLDCPVSARLSYRKSNDTSKYERKFLNVLFTALENSSWKGHQVYNCGREEINNFQDPISGWRILELLCQSVFVVDYRFDLSHWLMDVCDSSTLYRYSTSCISSIKVNRKRLPRKGNKEDRDLIFVGNYTTIHSRNKIFKNSTRIERCSGSNCNNRADTTHLNLNYRGISLKQNVSLSSNNTSSLIMFKEELVNYFKSFSCFLCNAIFSGILLLVYQNLNQTSTSLLDFTKLNHGLQAVFRSTKSSSLGVTVTLEEFNNLTSMGYIDHTVHVLFVLEGVLKAIFLGYIWCLHFLACFNDKLRRKRHVLFRLLRNLNFKLQLKWITLHIHIKYNSPTYGICKFPVQQQNLSHADNYSNEDGTYEGIFSKEGGTCQRDDNFSDESLFSTAYRSLSLSETEHDSKEDYNLKSETAESSDTQTVKYDSELNTENPENVIICGSKVIYEYDNYMSLKNDNEFKFVPGTENYDIDHTYVKYQQSSSNEDGEDTETSLKTIGSDSADEYLDDSLSGDITNLNDLNISPREGSKTKECINKNLLLCSNTNKETEGTAECVVNSTEFINFNKMCENEHMNKFDRPDIDCEYCSSTLDTLSSYNSTKMGSKGNNSFVLSSLQSLTSSSGLENVEFYHCNIDVNQSCYTEFHTSVQETCAFETKQRSCNVLHTPVEETNAFSTAINIVTSSSPYKETYCSVNIRTGHRTYIAQSVRKFLKKYRKRQRRRFIRTIRQYTLKGEDIETNEIICNPVYAKDTSSNSTDRRPESFPESESTPVPDTQIHTAENQISVYQSTDYESSLGTLSSIFNDISIQSLNENEGYQYEWIRLASFTNFSSEAVHATRLARCGWYSTGNGDQTTCFSCHRIHENWTRNDDPNGNRLHDSNCRLMLQVSNNRPIPRESTIHRDLGSESSVPENNTQDHSQRINQHINSGNTTILSANLSSQNALPFRNGLNEDRSERHPTTPTPIAEAATSERARETQLEALMRDPMGINFDRPKYPSYAILAVRLSSYTDWPSSMTQTPRDMALAGFFYAGHGDYTRCFFCGGGLRNWEAGDDPWVEHARWFSKCAFVRQNRGQQFIDLVLRRAAEIEQQQTESQHEEPTESKQAKEAKIMNSAAVRSIKDMGYSEEKIKEAINTIKSRLPKGKHKVSAHEILEVLFELADSSSSGATLNSAPTPQQMEPTTGSQRIEHQTSTNLTANTNEEGGATSAVNNLTLNDLESLQRENSSLKDQIICKICMEKNVSIAFLPCGHLACCADCAPAMRKCPICREFVRGTVKTYLV